MCIIVTILYTSSIFLCEESSQKNKVLMHLRLKGIINDIVSNI